MTLTRMTVTEIDGKRVESIERGLPDDNPIKYFGNEDEPIDNIDPKTVIRGFAAFKEHINRKGRPKSDNPKQAFSVRIPEKHLKILRATGKGWQTRASQILVNAIDAGQLQDITVS